MSEPSSPLESRVSAVLRERPCPPEGARERVRARLLATIAGSGGSSPASNSGTSPNERGLSKGAVSGISLVLGAGAGALLHATLSHAPVPTIVYRDRPTPAVTATVNPTATASTLPPVAPTALTPAATASGAAARPPSSAGPSQFAAERQVLDEARDALVQGDPDRALARVETHRRRFLNPLLAEERDAMEVEALARAGRLAEARARAEQFKKRSPDSLFMPTVQSAVESNP